MANPESVKSGIRHWAENGPVGGSIHRTMGLEHLILPLSSTWHIVHKSKTSYGSETGSRKSRRHLISRAVSLHFMPWKSLLFISTVHWDDWSWLCSFLWWYQWLLLAFAKLPTCDDKLFNYDPCDEKQVKMNPAFSAFQIFPPISLRFWSFQKSLLTSHRFWKFRTGVQCHHNQSFKFKHDRKKDASTSASPVTINQQWRIQDFQEGEGNTNPKKVGGWRQPIFWLNYIYHNVISFCGISKAEQIHFYTCRIEKLHEYLNFGVRVSPSVQFSSFSWAAISRGRIQDSPTLS